jgi:hypothetical protein
LIGEEAVGSVVVYGHGFPREVLWLAGYEAVDETRPSTPVTAQAGSRISIFLEPFLDPYVRSFLLRLERGDFDRNPAVVFLRESPGALHAYQYALEFRRLGLLPEDGPALLIFNLLLSSAEEALLFNAAELDRLEKFLIEVQSPRATSFEETLKRVSLRASILGQIAEAQSEGSISAAAAFSARNAAMPVPLARSIERLELLPDASLSGPRAHDRRLALLGSPLAGDGLHRLVEEYGILALDLQSGPAAPTAPQNLMQAVLRFTENSFSPRQARPDAYVESLGPLLAAHRIETVLWQVDPADDLWGWLMPNVRDLCERMDIGFIDLGFIPAWPDNACLDGARRQLRGDMP